jgi:hypothetical protein
MGSGVMGSENFNATAACGSEATTTAKNNHTGYALRMRC